MYEDESVLVIKRELFDEIGTFQGISTEIDKYLPAFLNPSNNFFIHRELAEDDPTHKQIIPYAIFKHGDKFLKYLRGKKSGEQRLASKSSIGIGGHINQDDFNSSSLEKDTYLTGIEREINEELIITNKDLNLIGKKTKEILDTMYSNCQFSYLNAIWALLKTDVTSHDEENELDEELSKTIEDSIKPQYLEKFFDEE